MKGKRKAGESMSNRAGWNDEMYSITATVQSVYRYRFRYIVVAEGIKIHTVQYYLNLSTCEGGKETCMYDQSSLENIDQYIVNMLDPCSRSKSDSACNTCCSL